MTDLFYRLTNSLVAVTFASVMGFAVYKQAPELWARFDSAAFSGVLVITLVGILTIGFCTLESRKA